MDTAQSRNSLSDEQIVDQVVGGEKEAYGILLDRYQHLVCRLALTMLGSSDMVEDVVQESFLIGYENLERLRNPASFASWIAGITRNICRNLMRERKKTPVSLDYLSDIGIEPSDSGNSPYYDKELVVAVRKLIPRLPDRYRVLIELRYTEGFSCQKIADFLNLSKSAVITRLHRARKQLLRLLETEGRR